MLLCSTNFLALNSLYFTDMMNQFLTADDNILNVSEKNYLIPCNTIQHKTNL